MRDHAVGFRCFAPPGNFENSLCLIVCVEMIWIKIRDYFISRADESVTRVDSSHHYPSDLVSLILNQITPKECTRSPYLLHSESPFNPHSSVWPRLCLCWGGRGGVNGHCKLPCTCTALNFIELSLIIL